ncbi:hypothetical protein [Kitasatospora sp. NPDC090091]|uniref:hypothetical protein n=1 Tax=Kitasatospora sp. NPDC090091 TaxID=3364081 RepID=UPI0038227B22
MSTPLYFGEGVKCVMTQAWDWSSLQSMSRPVYEIPRYLELLVSGSPQASRGARSVLYCEVANQGQLYTAAAACVDFLAGYVRAGGRLNSAALRILEEILNARTPGSTVEIDGRAVDTAAYCRERTLDVIPDILRTADPVDLDQFDAVCFLIPQLADSVPQIIDFLHRHANHPVPGVRKPVLEALEEAEEVVRDGHNP